MKFEASILKYMGTFKKGVVVLFTIKYKSKHYEATFFYNEKDILLTISDEMENDLENNIKLDPDYPALLKSILSQIAPYEEVKTMKPIK